MPRNSLKELENTVNSIIGQNLDYLQEYAQIRPDGFIKTLFTFSMIRLKASFEAAMLLMRKGYYIELSSIFRMILEQLSWECYLFTVNEIHIKKDPTKLKSPQQTVSFLKTTLNKDIYGQVYGILSTEAHLSVTRIKRYLDIHADECKADIIFQAEEVDDDDISMLLLLVGTYVEVTSIGIKRFGFSNKTLEADFIKRYDDWYKEVIRQLSKLILSNDPLIADQ